MKALQTYIDQKNRWNAIFNGKQYEFQSKFGRQEIAGMLDAEMSPENLTCDGELSRAQIASRYRTLTKVGAELHKLDPTIKMYELSYF